MKFLLSSLALTGLAIAAPTPTTNQNAARAKMVKRASITDSAFGYAYENGRTTAGAGGTTTTVTSYAQFTAAVTGDDAKVVIVEGTFSQAADQVKFGSNTSILGKDSGAGLIGNVVRNLAVSLVLAENGDVLGIQYSTNVWVNHVDVSSNRDHDKDYYDGLIDITHASNYVTISNCYIHDHWKASLVGHSDSSGDEDIAYLQVTHANKYWENINSRGPSFRFGTGHIYNSYYRNVADGISTRDGAQALVKSNTWSGSSTKNPLYSTDAGYTVANEALAGTLTSVPYEYTLLGSANVKAAGRGDCGCYVEFLRG